METMLTHKHDDLIDEPAPNSAEVAPGVYVVRPRPVGFSAKLLPPLLLVILGAGFLIYRSTASDWRGVFALFSRSPRAMVSKPVAKQAPLLALNDAPKTEEPQPVAPAVTKEEPAKAKAEVPVNPLEDIKREAEKTKEKIAELEKLKEEEKAKQDSTSRQRQNMPRDRMIAAQRELLKRQMAWMAEIQERQMREMADMQRRFLGRDFAGMPFPAFPDMDMGINNGGFLPGMPPRGLRNAPAPPQPQPGDDGKEIVRKTPEGVTKFRRFQGPNGSQGFIYEFRSNTPQAKVPPPPEPKRFD
jgi:hypothetical protein